MEKAKQKKKINYMAYLERMFKNEFQRYEFISYCAIYFDLSLQQLAVFFAMDPKVLHSKLFSCNNGMERAVNDHFKFFSSNQEESYIDFENYIRHLIIGYVENKDTFNRLVALVKREKLHQNVIKYRKEGIYPLNDEKVLNVMSFRLLHSLTSIQLADYFGVDHSKFGTNLKSHLDKMLEKNPDDLYLKELYNGYESLNDHFKNSFIKNNLFNRR